MVSTFFMMLSLLIFIAWLSGCTQQPQQAIIQQPQQQVSPSKKIVLDDLERLVLHELPVPLGLDLISYKKQENSIYCRYQGTIPKDKIDAFIQADSERLGWHLEPLVSPGLTAYVVKKGTQTALLLVDAVGNKVSIRVSLKTSASL